MTTEPLYLITGSEALARFRVAGHSGVEGPLVSLYTGGSTITLSAEDALALSRALLAVASGKFEVAETDLAIALRAEDTARRRAIQAQNRATADSVARPSLLDTL